MALGGGLTRRDPAVLLAAGVHLPRLVDQLSAASAEQFLNKLGTLARLARSAGHAKQDFLRLRGRKSVTRGFLLDRARLVVWPIGLGFVVHELAHRRLCDNGGGIALAIQIVRRLRDALAQERPRTLEMCLDSGPRQMPAHARCEWFDDLGRGRLAAPATASAGELHASADGGAATVLIPSEAMLPAEESAALIGAFLDQHKRQSVALRAGWPAKKTIDGAVGRRRWHPLISFARSCHRLGRLPDPRNH